MAKPYPPLTLTHDPPLPILVGYRLVMSGPYACSTSVYVQNLSATHAFAVVWRLVYAFCCSSLTLYGGNYFLTPHSLQFASFKGWVLLGCGLSFLDPILCSFCNPTATSCYTNLLFLSRCYLACTCWASLDVLLILLLMTQYGHCFYTHVTLGFS